MKAIIKFLQSVNTFPKIWHLFIVNLAISLLIVVFFFGKWYDSFGQFLVSLAWSYSICFTQWVGNVYVNKLIGKRYTWDKNSIKRAVFGALGIIIYTPIAYVLVQLIAMKLVYGNLPDNIVEMLLRSTIITLAISFVISLVFTTVGFLNAWKKTLIESERMKVEMLAYKYEALQNQINPHFLFNSFNVLSDLVYEDKKKAVDFIRQMSQLFRYVLDSKDKELIEANDELEFAETFAYLLQIRFENKLNINFDLKFESNEMLVPMTLQLLIENCVKHNEVSGQKPLNVNITRFNNTVNVVNNIQYKNVGDESKKLGLNNLQQQYSYFSENEISIDRTETTFAVAVPILKID